MMRRDYLRAARCPSTLTPREFGLWSIERRRATCDAEAKMIGGEHQTLLRHATMATLHNGGEIVMEDSLIELSQHLPIWMHGRGRVLVTGLGLGCVVRGLLTNPDVEHITVVEIDRGIIDNVWPEFAGDPRTEIVHDDALRFAPGLMETFDFAWHDLWTVGDQHLQLLHGQLLMRYRHHARRQGAWKLPRLVKRLCRRVPGRANVAIIG